MNRWACLIGIVFVLAGAPEVFSQEFIPLWETGMMPNTKGLEMKDSIFNERYWRVGNPGMYAFFPSRQENKHAAVVLCPGGGYHHYAYQSTFQVAKWFNTMGISAFVLISRLPFSPDLTERSKAPLQDAQRAMRIVRAHASAWGIASDKIGVMGFSAGGHLASTLGTHLEDVSDVKDSLSRFSYRPDFMLLVSPVITMGALAHKGSRDNLLGSQPSEALIRAYSSELQVTNQTPPAFIVVAENDQTVPSENSVLFFQALREKKVSASLHVFPQGGHAIGMQGNPGSTKLWKELCELWLAEKGFIE
jgi:acetyl esterase/lipase